MADDGTAVTLVNPDAWRKSFVAKRGDAGVKTLSPDEWKASYTAKKSAAVPDASKMTQAQAVQQLEGGGLQAPTIDPIDIMTFGAAGGAMGALKGPARSGA